MFGKSAKTGKLIVTAIACAVDPTGISLAAAGLDAAIHAQDEWFTKNPTLGKLAAELQTAFEAEIAKPYYDKPDGIRILLPQMLEAAMSASDAFAEQSLDAPLVLDQMKQQLRDPEHLLPAHLDAFAQVTLPLLFTACNDTRLVAALQPALTRQQGKANREQEAKLDQILAAVQSNVSLVPLEEMVRLAQRFGETDIPDRASLEKLLTSKAEEYRALKSEVDNISADMKRLANLKAAAQDAIERVDLDEVERLLTLVQTTELEEAAKTAELRANNALLRGDVDKAFLLLKTAADSFLTVDPFETARRKLLIYCINLQSFSMRFGKGGLSKAADLAKEALTADLKAEAEDLWQFGMQNLAIILQQMGSRSEGQEGLMMLEESARVSREVTNALSFSDDPMEWASTRNTLGVTLRELGMRESGDARKLLLAQAVSEFDVVLMVRTLKTYPLERAQTQNNLGNTLHNLGIHPAEPKKLVFLRLAESSYREALSIYSFERNPQEWAMTKNNLGVTLKDIGILSDDHAMTPQFLNSAISEFRDATKVNSLEEEPVEWALIRENVALCHFVLSITESIASPYEELSAALRAVDNALEVFDPVHMSYNHTKATHLRDEILARLDP